MVTFNAIKDIKRQPVVSGVSSGVRGFPIPMSKQMTQGPKRPKVRYPLPTKPKLK
jgi:hypothetical protein